MTRKRQLWKEESLFAVRLDDTSFVIGQILQGGKDVITCAFSNLQFPQKPSSIPEITETNIIAVLEVTVNHLEKGEWTVIGQSPIVLEKEKWPNEKFANQDYVGAKSYTSPIAQKFLNAYFGLAPWNEYKDPDFFDSLLYDGRQRPNNAVFKHS